MQWHIIVMHTNFLMHIFFDSNVYKRSDFIRFDFDMVYRQSDGALLENLTRLRGGDTNALGFFNECRIDDSERRSNAILITPFRNVAEQINSSRLAQIDSPSVMYTGTLSGTFSERDVPAPLNLTLKVGALVVFVKNGDKWHNGSMGIIRALGARDITVQLLSDNRDMVVVKPEKWEKIEYSRDENDRIVENEVGGYKQFPLNLGYAMTIHKAQGKTLDAVVVDMSRGAFAHGQTYVAYIGLLIMGIKYALLFALMSFVLDFIPYFGSLLAGVIEIFYALLTGSLGLAVAVAIFVLVVQQLEGNIAAPKIQGDATGIHPITIMFALLACNVLWGPLGMLISTPIAIIVKAILSEVHNFLVSDDDNRSGQSGTGANTPQTV